MLRIAELRKERGVTQKNLASMLGISAGNLCEWEKGRIEPSLEALKQLSLIFDVSIDYLVGRTDDFGNVCVPGQTSDLTADDALMKDFNKLDVYEQEYIRGQIKALVAKKDLEKEKV